MEDYLLVLLREDFRLVLADPVDQTVPKQRPHYDHLELDTNYYSLPATHAVKRDLGLLPQAGTLSQLRVIADLGSPHH